MDVADPSRYRFSWRGGVQREDKAPGYWVTGLEFRALVERFGLIPQLDDTDAKRVNRYPRVVPPTIREHEGTI